MVITATSQELSPSSFHVDDNDKSESSYEGALQLPSTKKTISKPLVDEDDDNDFTSLYGHISSTSFTVSPSGASLSVASLSKSDLADFGYEDAAPDRRSLCESPKVPCDAEEDIRDYDSPKTPSRPKAPCDTEESIRNNDSPKTPKTPSRRPRVECRSALKTPGSKRECVVNNGKEIEVKLPWSDKPLRRRQSISFCEGVTVQAIKPVTEMHDNKKDLWYPSSDLDEMVSRSYRLVKKAAKGKKKYCTRGLEKMQDEGVLDRVNSAMDAVLGEQDLQFDHGCFDEKRIQEAYSLKSLGCKETARRRAEEDAKAIDSYLSETRLRIRRMSL